jgi:type 1 glutamine amidotransferase
MNTKLSTLFVAGDRYHNPQDAFDGLAGLFSELDIPVHVTSDYTQINLETLGGARLLILHRDGMLFPNGEDQAPVHWMTPAQEDAIENFVHRGGAFLALHNSGWDYPWDGPYRRVLGGYYLTHPPISTFQVRVINPNHPVTAGVHDFEIEDEQHWLWFDYDRVDLLLTNHGRDGRQSAAGWAYKFGQGRVVYLANGHTAQAHAHPEFMRLKRNALRWLLHMS